MNDPAGGDSEVAIGKHDTFPRQIRELFRSGTVRDLTDGQLLERFATDRGESAEHAFSALVERHGPMVWRVCRSVLVDPDDSQDAFQATFLILVKKARGLWVRQSLGPWLYQVAYRTASWNRSALARRRRVERSAPVALYEPSRTIDHDLGPILYEELHKLPERYRAPIILCDLEERTHEQAASALGWPIGTVKSRIARGRERLRGRLVRRGLTPQAVIFGATYSLPSTLIDKTTRTVIAIATIRASALTLAQEVLRSMLMAHLGKAAAMMLVVGATISGAAKLAQDGKPGAGDGVAAKAKAADDLPVYTAKSGKFRLALSESGVIEAASTVDGVCPLPVGANILSILEPGTAVKKGDLVCKLDDSNLTARLPLVDREVEIGEADYRQAELAREIAEMAVKEYEKGTFERERGALRDVLEQAELAAIRAKARRDRTHMAREHLTERLAKQESPGTTDVLAKLDLDDRVDAAEEEIARQRVVVREGLAKMVALEEYTRPKMVKELTVQVERARFKESEQKRQWLFKQNQAKTLRDQIASCRMLAPIDGTVIPVRVSYNPDDPSRPYISEGMNAHAGQILFKIQELRSPLRVAAKVHEPRVDRIVPGQKVNIKVRRLGDQIITGNVIEVAPRADPFRPDAADQPKLYHTLIKIENSPPGLRPGMSAQTEIIITDLDNVITVPLAAVLMREGKTQVALEKPGGGFEWRDVTVGETNDEFAEIKQGIQAGDSVILNPSALLTEAERTKGMT